LLKNFEPKPTDDPTVDKVTLYKEQLIKQIDELFQRKIQYDICQLREKIQYVQAGISDKQASIKEMMN
jgi:predicted HAD superfamily phosphohydrolase